MTWHEATVGGYLVLIGAAVGLQLTASRSDSRIPSLGRMAGYIMRTRAGRISVLTAWAWVGLHFFAR